MADENVAENDPIGYGSHFLLQQPDLTHVAWLDPKIHHTFKGMKLTSSPEDAPTDEILEATLCFLSFGKLAGMHAAETCVECWTYFLLPLATCVIKTNNI